MEQDVSPAISTISSLSIPSTPATPQMNEENLPRFPESDKFLNGNFYTDHDMENKNEVNTKHNKNCAMEILLTQIALKKAEIMKNLETNGDKCALNNNIALLQELQRAYVDYEKNQTHCCTLCQYVGSGGESNDSQQSDHSGSYVENELYQTTPPQHHDSIKSDESGEYSINIPNYILRGAGKQTHYEYEVKINLQGEQWTILRRYSRFRELYLSMKRCYGETVCILKFK